MHVKQLLHYMAQTAVTNNILMLKWSHK